MPRLIVMLDAVVMILKTHERTAAVTYEGVRGYQLVVVVWVGQVLIVHDEFFDGTVPHATTTGPMA